jgi:uncharacterized protein YlxP (DUF503 family)
MVVGVLQLDLHLHGVHSLKEKRSVVRRLLARCRNRYPVSAAEVGHQDLWQRTLIGVALVSSSEAVIAPILDRLEEDLHGEAEVIDVAVEYLHI